MSVIAIVAAAVIVFWLGLRVGLAIGKTYRCQKCGEWDAEQERIDADEERFRKESGV